MKALIKWDYLLCVLAVAALAAVSFWVGRSHAVAETAALPVFESSDLVPRWYPAEELRRKAGSFPEFELRDQAGRRFEREDLAGRIVVANFFFTGCSSLCPRLRNGMAHVRDALTDEDALLLLSHSVTPEQDDTRVLAAYARANGIDGERWRLLTGPRGTITNLIHDAYLVPAPPSDEGGILHTELFVLLDQQQRVRGLYNGTLALDIDQLIRDIQLLREG